MEKTKVTITFEIPLLPMMCGRETEAGKMIEKVRQYVESGDLTAEDLIDTRIERKIDIKIGVDKCPRCLKESGLFICKPCYEVLAIKSNGFDGIVETMNRSRK